MSDFECARKKEGDIKDKYLSLTIADVEQFLKSEREADELLRTELMIAVEYVKDVEVIRAISELSTNESLLQEDADGNTVIEYLDDVVDRMRYDKTSEDMISQFEMIKHRALARTCDFLNNKTSDVGKNIIMQAPPADGSKRNIDEGLLNKIANTDNNLISEQESQRTEIEPNQPTAPNNAPVDGDIVDKGTHLEAIGFTNKDVEAKAMIEAAKGRGWSRVSIDGNEGYVKLAIMIAIENGMEIIPKNDMQTTMLISARKDFANKQTEQDNAINVDDFPSPS